MDILRSELYLPAKDKNQKIYIQKWATNSPTAGTILLTHGVAEHSDSHKIMSEALAKNNYQVIAWDLPGHGRSYGQRGYISSFTEYLDGLQLVYNYVRTNHAGEQPLFLFGHSLGGLITFSFAGSVKNLNYASLCLSSPAFGITAEVPMIKDLAARWLYRIAPKVTIPHEINFLDLSRDQKVIENYYKDPLRHKKFSAPLYIGMLSAMENCMAKAHQFRQPIFIQAAGTDRVVSVEATKSLFSKLASPTKTLKIYPDSYHEIFNDLNRQEVIDDLLNYLRQF